MSCTPCRAEEACPPRYGPGCTCRSSCMSGALVKAASNGKVKNGETVSEIWCRIRQFACPQCIGRVPGGSTVLTVNQATLSAGRSNIRMIVLRAQCKIGACIHGYNIIGFPLLGLDSTQGHLTDPGWVTQLYLYIHASRFVHIAIIRIFVRHADIPIAPKKYLLSILSLVHCLLIIARLGEIDRGLSCRTSSAD